MASTPRGQSTDAPIYRSGAAAVVRAYGQFMQRWLWVTLPDVYQHHRFALDDLDTWSCHEDTRPGDLALLYRADLLRDFSHVWRVETDPYEDPGIRREFDSLACDCRLVAALRRPVTLPEIRQDPVLSRWPAALADFHGSKGSFPMGPGEGRAFVALTDPVLDRRRLRSLGFG